MSRNRRSRSPKYRSQVPFRHHDAELPTALGSRCLGNTSDDGGVTDGFFNSRTADAVHPRPTFRLVPDQLEPLEKWVGLMLANSAPNVVLLARNRIYQWIAEAVTVV